MMTLTYNHGQDHYILSCFALQSKFRQNLVNTAELKYRKIINTIPIFS